MKKNLLLVASLFFGTVAFAQECASVTTLNEDFSTFTANAVSEKCWTGSHAHPMVTVDNTTKAANLYTFFSPNTYIYLVTPELSNIDGEHKISFDISRIGAPSTTNTLTFQLGTQATATGFADFVPVGDPIVLGAEESLEVVIPASTTQKFISFRVIGTAAHLAAALDNVTWSEVEVVTPECEAVATLDENFNDFTVAGEDESPIIVAENCWSTSSTGPIVYTDVNDDATNTFVTFYANNSADTAGYLVSPELIAIDGTRTLSFDASALPSIPGTVTTVQIGTLATATDFANFHAIGEATTLVNTGNTFTNVAIPTTTDKFIAFKFTSSFAHGAGTIDNIKYDTTVSREDFNKTSFSVYPNPTADKNVTISHNIDAKGTVSVYTLTGALVSNSELSTGSQNLNLSSLSAGMYIVKIEAGNQTATQKLIVQ